MRAYEMLHQLDRDLERFAIEGRKLANMMDEHADAEHCRLANQNKLADQAADILDLAFAGREADRQKRIGKRRAELKLLD